MDETMTDGAVLEPSMSAKIRAQVEAEQARALVEMRDARRARDEVADRLRRRKKKARKAAERSAARNRR